jgi:hypothetical protein
MQDPRLVYDLFEFGNFEKFWKSQRNPNWDDCGFAHLGQNLSLHPHLHCIVQAAGL